MSSQQPQKALITPQRVVMIHPDAPGYPGFGRSCNGCGLCCLAAPCPMGMLVTGKRKGPCDALVWSMSASEYRCGLILKPRDFVPVLPERLVRALVHRWIAAGAGCDAHLERLDIGASKS